MARVGTIRYFGVQISRSWGGKPALEGTFFLKINKTGDYVQNDSALSSIFTRTSIALLTAACVNI